MIRLLAAAVRWLALLFTAEAAYAEARARAEATLAMLNNNPEENQ